MHQLYGRKSEKLLIFDAAQRPVMEAMKQWMETEGVQISCPYLLLIKEKEPISHHKMIEGIVTGNLLQREIGVEDVAYLQ